MTEVHLLTYDSMIQDVSDFNARDLEQNETVRDSKEMKGKTKCPGARSLCLHTP